MAPCLLLEPTMALSSKVDEEEEAAVLCLPFCLLFHFLDHYPRASTGHSHTHTHNTHIDTIEEKDEEGELLL